MTAVAIGVDPGKTGAIAVVTDIDGLRLLRVDDMPVVDKLVNAPLLAQLFDGAYGLSSMTAPCPTVVIEDVHAMPANGSIGSFSLGRSKGVVEGVAAGLLLPVAYTAPSAWKKAMRLSADKSASRRRAIELWPAQAHLFARVKDDGRAEAALIAVWWLTRNGGREGVIGA